GAIRSRVFPGEIPNGHSMHLDGNGLVVKPIGVFTQKHRRNMVLAPVFGFGARDPSERFLIEALSDG
ncbi:hypothetical protein, partial [Paenirhodobacter enshiensis]|uniref:hypothetical protein n=1 Tax=Paenirhodobacter enshiensis TaxID=1105367 RepID=UPI001B80977D